MAASEAFVEQQGGLRRHLLIALGLLVALAVGYWIYTQATAVQGVKVEAPPPVTVDMLPPPPPPPPPPPEPQQKPPEPTDTQQPVPQLQPQAPAPLTQNAPAEAGGDAFGLQSGSGNGLGSPGSTGTCIGPSCGNGGGTPGVSDGFYRRYLSGALQERVQGNDKVNRLVFTAEFAITVSPSGVITAVELLRSSGKGDRDKLLKSILEQVRGLDAPPGSMRFPQRITVRGRRAI